MPPIDILLADDLLNANPSWTAVDVGCGEFPYLRARVCCDIHVEDKPSLVEGVRAWRDFGIEQTFVRGDLCKGLPFDDKQFDLSICRFCLEHVEDPEAACRELTRISRYQYVLVPKAPRELLYNAPFHRWTCKLGSDDALVFRAKRESAMWTGPKEFCGVRFTVENPQWKQATEQCLALLHWARQSKIERIFEGLVGRVEA